VRLHGFGRTDGGWCLQAGGAGFTPVDIQGLDRDRVGCRDPRWPEILIGFPFLAEFIRNLAAPTGVKITDGPTCTNFMV
jgi:hypothetical protein